MRAAARIMIPAVLALAGLAAAGCREARAVVPGAGDADRGVELIAAYRCGDCHSIPGIRTATGVVAPPLDHFGRRSFIAGILPNTHDNLVAWIREPGRIAPNTAMPALGVTEAQARDIAAYLGDLD